MSITRAQIAAVLAVGLGTGVAPLDSAVNIAFPLITGGFGLPLPMIQWVVVCYVLTYASLMLGFGRLGDIFGYRRVFFIGLVWSGVSLALCAAAPSFAWLLFFRALQGIGTALVLSCGPALITLAFPEAMRTRILGAYTFMYAIASAVGPSLGGLLSDLWGWPAIFWFRIPIVLVSLALLPSLKASTEAQGGQRFDLAGAGLLVLSLSSILFALNQGYHATWGGGVTAALFLFAVLTTAAFLWHEKRTPQPIIDLAMFRDLYFTAVNLANLLVQMAAFSVLLLVPYYLVQVMEMAPAYGGLILATSAVGMMAGSAVAGPLMERCGEARAAALSALVLAAGLFAIGTWSHAPALAFALGALFVHGIGQGVFQVAYFDIVLGTLPRAQRGVAGSLTMVTRTIGTVGGVTGGALLFSILETRQAGRGAGEMASFIAGFQGTFMWASVVAALSCCLLSFWHRPRLSPSR